MFDNFLKKRYNLKYGRDRKKGFYPFKKGNC